jgi:Fur family zinc uptake transcriptional regulator
MIQTPAQASRGKAPRGKVPKAKSGQPPKAELHRHGHSHDHAHGHEHGSELHSALTPGRRRILTILEEAGQPLGAYEMIDRLASANGKRPAPISIYRALDFLVDQGLVHRLASRNAFMACGQAHQAHEMVAFLICDVCGLVSEVASQPMRKSLTALAQKIGFCARDQIIEVTGRCAACQGLSLASSQKGS